MAGPRRKTVALWLSECEAACCFGSLCREGPRVEALTLTNPIFTMLPEIILITGRLERSIAGCFSASSEPAPP